MYHYQTGQSQFHSNLTSIGSNVPITHLYLSKQHQISYITHITTYTLPPPIPISWRSHNRLSTILTTIFKIRQGVIGEDQLELIPVLHSCRRSNVTVHSNCQVTASREEHRRRAGRMPVDRWPAIGVIVEVIDQAPGPGSSRDLAAAVCRPARSVIDLRDPGVQITRIDIYCGHREPFRTKILWPPCVRVRGHAGWKSRPAIIYALVICHNRRPPPYATWQYRYGLTETPTNLSLSLSRLRLAWQRDDSYLPLNQVMEFLLVPLRYFFFTPLIKDKRIEVFLEFFRDWIGTIRDNLRII